MSEELTKKLNSLAQVDIDAYHAYGQAIDSIKDPKIREELVNFQKEHEQHVQNLAKAVTNLGGTPVEFSRDFKGFLISGYTSVRSLTGDMGVLKAMDTNENITNRSYEDMLSQSLPDDIRQLVEKQEKDEKKHRAYIEKAILELS